MNNENNFLEKFLQRWLPPSVSSSSTYKTSPPGLHNQDSSLDICAKFQSFTVCYSIDCHVVLHLCYHRDAGTIIWNIFLREFRPKYIITICHYLPQVFGNMEYNPDTEYNRHNNFKTFMAGILVLFRWVFTTSHIKCFEPVSSRCNSVPIIDFDALKDVAVRTSQVKLSFLFTTHMATIKIVVNSIPLTPL